MSFYIGRRSFIKQAAGIIGGGILGATGGAAAGFETAPKIVKEFSGDQVPDELHKPDDKVHLPFIGETDRANAEAGLIAAETGIGAAAGSTIWAGVLHILEDAYEAEGQRFRPAAEEISENPSQQKPKKTIRGKTSPINLVGQDPLIKALAGEVSKLEAVVFSALDKTTELSNIEEADSKLRGYKSAIEIILINEETGLDHALDQLVNFVKQEDQGQDRIIGLEDAKLALEKISRAFDGLKLVNRHLNSNRTMFADIEEDLVIPFIQGQAQVSTSVDSVRKLIEQLPINPQSSLSNSSFRLLVEKSQLITSNVKKASDILTNIAKLSPDLHRRIGGSPGIRDLYKTLVAGLDSKFQAAKEQGKFFREQIGTGEAQLERENAKIQLDKLNNFAAVIHKFVQTAHSRLWSSNPWFSSANEQILEPLSRIANLIDQTASDLSNLLELYEQGDSNAAEAACAELRTEANTANDDLSFRADTHQELADPSASVVTETGLAPVYGDGDGQGTQAEDLMVTNLVTSDGPDSDHGLGLVEFETKSI